MSAVRAFGEIPDGQKVQQITLANDVLSVSVLTLGAIVQDLRFEGRPMVLGSQVLDPYLGPMAYFGALVGRVANRISNGETTLFGRPITLDRNEQNGNCLHGGGAGSARLLWSVRDVKDTSVTLHLRLPDGHMGFPGAMDVCATYLLRGACLSLVIEACTDLPTLCNFAPHSYFNLSGAPHIDGHVLQISADHYLPVNAAMIPTGEVAPVDQTPFDFRKDREIAGTAMDHNFCLGPDRAPLRHVARLSGGSQPGATMMDVATTEAGLQVYTADHFRPLGLPLDLGHLGARAGVALEALGWPDAPNHLHFPSILLRPQDAYVAQTSYAFSTRL